MKPAQIPEDEAERQAALDDYEIVDTLAEQDYDDLTFLAASICETPIALVSLVDKDRQWFKSRVGLDATETPRDISFCGHVVADRAPLFVENTLEDERFADNPLVTGAPDIRFYGGAPLVTAGGHHLGTLCVIDRKERQLSETQQSQLLALGRQVSRLLELRRQRREAERANMIKSLFLSRMSHELRTPLNAVIGFANVLKKNKGGRMADREVMFAQRIGRSGAHLLSLVNDILDLSKIEAGREEFDLEDVLIADLIGDVMQAVPSADEERPIPLTTTIPAPLRSATVRADVRRLRQVLLNLLANASKYGGGTAVDVVLIDDGTGEVARIEVTDHGAGIAPERLEYVFGTFNQLDESDANQRATGTGLGLPISRALCRGMGWDLVASSEPGKGATFSIVIAPAGAGDGLGTT